MIVNCLLRKFSVMENKDLYSFPLSDYSSDRIRSLDYGVNTIETQLSGRMFAQRHLPNEYHISILKPLLIGPEVIVNCLLRKFSTMAIKIWSSFPLSD